MRLVILDSGIANVASVASAFAAVGVEPIVTRDPAVAREATRLVLPGVGSFGAGMAALRSTGLDQVVREAVERGTPLLAICLGLQLLTEGSDESPGVAGLGLIAARCTRLPETVRVPQLGWNAVTAGDAETMVGDGFAAYANSYAIVGEPEGWAAAWTTHGVRFAAALERGSVLATQFHPELSGEWGLSLLHRWLTWVIPSAARDLASSPASGPSNAAGASPRREIPRCARDDTTRVIRRIVPCLDVADGRIVKGIRFQGLRDAGDPAERAALYEAQGADEIVILDITASPERRETQTETIRRVRRAVHIPLTVGGGVRSVADAARLLAAGADKVSVNTAAVLDPALLERLAAAFGCQCVVLAVDAQRKTAATDCAEEWRVLTNGGRADGAREAIEWIRAGTDLGAGEILLTSWDRDGTRAGADLELVGAATTAVPVPVIASGGIGTRANIAEAFDAGADAVLAASIFHDGEETVAGVKTWLAARGYTVRP